MLKQFLSVDNRRSPCESRCTRSHSLPKNDLWPMTLELLWLSASGGRSCKEANGCSQGCSQELHEALSSEINFLASLASRQASAPSRGEEMPTSQWGRTDAGELSWRERGWCGLAQPPGLKPVGIFPPSPVPQQFQNSESKVTLVPQSCVWPASWKGPGLVSPSFPATPLLISSQSLSFFINKVGVTAVSAPWCSRGHVNWVGWWIVPAVDVASH